MLTSAATLLTIVTRTQIRPATEITANIVDERQAASIIGPLSTSTMSAPGRFEAMSSSNFFKITFLEDGKHPQAVLLGTEQRLLEDWQRGARKYLFPVADYQVSE